MSGNIFLEDEVVCGFSFDFILFIYGMCIVYFYIDFFLEDDEGKTII